jgi:hypothetical protein
MENEVWRYVDAEATDGARTYIYTPARSMATGSFTARVPSHRKGQSRFREACDASSQ